jgi:hypothetical protein
MTSKISRSIAERRRVIARRIFQTLVAQDPDRAVTLCDGNGGLVAQHDPLPTDEGGLPHVKATCQEDRRIDHD